MRFFADGLLNFFFFSIHNGYELRKVEMDAHHKALLINKPFKCVCHQSNYSFMLYSFQINAEVILFDHLRLAWNRLEDKHPFDVSI